MLSPGKPSNWLYPRQWTWYPFVGIVLLLAAMAGVNLRYSPPLYAQNASCGEPERTHKVDMDRNGTIDREVKFERCAVTTFDYAGQEKKVIVYYTVVNGAVADRLLPVDSDGNSTLDFTPESMAAFVRLWTVNSWRTFRDYGLNDPMSQSTFRIYVYDMTPGLLGWCCTGEHYEFDAPHLRNISSFNNDLRNGESVAVHEMWHAMDPGAASTLGGWVVEGSASYATDHVNLLLDNDNDNDYIGRVQAFMWGDHSKSLTTLEYRGAAWWSYFTEQLTGVNSEPNRGMDIMREFIFHPATTAFNRINALLAARGRNLNAFWLDFAVTNYTKNLAGGVDARWRYPDMLQSGAPAYPAVSLASDANITLVSGVGPSFGDVQAWATEYHRFNIAAGVPIINLEFRQDTNRRLGYALLKIRNNDLVETTFSIGRDFSASFANKNYTSVVVVVAAYEELANYRYTANATQPVLNLITPLQARKAFVGDPNAPGKFLIKLEVLNPAGGGTPIAGINAADFDIAVGSKLLADSDVVSSAYIQGQYWLLVRAPSQSSAGDYALSVNYGNPNPIGDSEITAVNYGPTKNTDNMVVIDRSGSMGSDNKATAARDGARLYVDSWRAGDQVGVATFNEDATLDLALGDWSLSRQAAIDKINGFVVAGDTSIGDGATTALNELVLHGIASHDWGMVLLSDGIENREALVATFLATYDSRKNANPPQQVPKINTVALGPDADRARLESLAAATGGNYYFAALPQAMAANGALGPAAINATYLSNDLGEIFRVASEQLTLEQQVYLGTSVLDFDAPVVTHTIMLDGAANQAVFVLKWNADGLGSNVTLLDPNGIPTDVVPVADWLHYVWRVPAPTPGQWLLVVDYQANCDPCAEEVLVEASVISDLTFDVFLGLAVDQRLVGRPMPIFAALSDSQPILNSTVTASIATPTGGFYVITLYDDGRHGDGAADDGFYGNIFYNTQEFGAYRMAVKASGNSPRTGDYERRLRSDFNMLEFRTWDPAEFPDIDPNIPLDRFNEFDPKWPVVDRDRDGLIDWWELEFGLDPELDSDDFGLDPDFDGYSNGDEFTNGTDPTTSDSDRGGENDFSERNSGRDPRDASDDQIGCPYAFYADTTYHVHDEPFHVDANLLRFEVDDDTAYVAIWRDTDPTAQPTPLDLGAPPTGVYTDTAVVDGTTYYYRLSAYDGEGNSSCILGPLAVQYRHRTEIPPEGWVAINDGSPQTVSNAVTLTLEATPGTTQMQVRNTVAAFDPDAGWVDYATTLPWTVVPQGEQAVVFVWFRTATEEVSAPVADVIAIAGEEEEPVRNNLPSIRK